MTIVRGVCDTHYVYYSCIKYLLYFLANVQGLFARGHFVPEFEEGPLHELHLVNVKVFKTKKKKKGIERKRNNNVSSRARF